MTVEQNLSIYNTEKTCINSLKVSQFNEATAYLATLEVALKQYLVGHCLNILQIADFLVISL